MVSQETAIRPAADALAKLIEKGCVEGVSGPVERIETHVSDVLLAGDRVFKLKKPVRMPFVDFTAVEQRRLACRAEVETNRRLGSPLYLGVTSIHRRADGSVGINGDRGITDWAVVMRRFDPGMQLDELALAGKLDNTIAMRTADRVATMHQNLQPVFTAGHVADYRKVIRDLRATETQGAEKHGLSIGMPAPYDNLDKELARIDPIIERRRTEGRVRRAHGDLHLRNICLFEGEVEPFDALEFDERLATTDVLYDLAFLLMDLRHRGLDEQANLVMNRYWDTAGEAESGLALLPFFMALRATVRMAVSVQAGKLDEAQQYRELTWQLLRHAHPRLVAIGGLSGTGKSTVARALAPRMSGPAGARILRSDVIRKRNLGLSPESDRAPSASYSPEKRAQTYRELAARAAQGLSAGTIVIADATFRVSCARDAITSIPETPYSAFWLRTPLATRLARIAARQPDASDADVEVAMEQVEPSHLGPEWQLVDAVGTVNATVDKIVGSMSADATPRQV